MSGLIENGVGETGVTRKYQALGDWAMRNAWRLALGINILAWVLFWLLIAAIFAQT